MDFFSEELPEDIEDSRWLSEETKLLSERLGTSLAAVSPSDLAAPSSSSTPIAQSNASSSTPPTPKPKFGAQVRIRFRENEFRFVLGRTNPMTLPLPVFEVLPTMAVGDRKRLDAKTSVPDHPSLVIARDSSSDTATDKKPSNQTGPTWDPSDEVELMEVEEVEHVVSGGSIVKRIISCPDETRNDRHTPVFETVVKLDMIGRLEDTDEIFDKRLDAEFRIGEGELGMGMEKAVRTMHRGEKSSFTFLPPWPVSLCANPLIPVPDLKNSVVVYEVHLKSFVDAKNPFECKTYEENLQEAILRKDSGNRAHEAKLFTLAITKYTKAQFFLEQYGTDFESDEQRATYDQLKATLALNLAASNLKLEQYEKVKLHCTNALELEPNNVKGLYRRASAHVALKDFESAKKDLSALLALEPENALAKHLMKRVEAKFAQDAIDERKIYQQMFAKMDDPKEQPLWKESPAVKSPTQSNPTNWSVWLLLSVIFIVFIAYMATLFGSAKAV
jgi:tetratricopeptide (TPR) repeat protein